MDIESAAQGFSAMGSGPRLMVLQALVRAGECGLSVGEIQERTGIAASTLAHHLKSLSAAGLINQRKQARAIVSTADFDHLATLAGFILEECCLDAEVRS
jgi:ArsR family transcriptional regulator